MKKLLFAIALLLMPLCVFATDSNIGNAKVRDIVISGTSRTEANTVLRELTFHVGDIINSTHILQSVQNLKNTNLFSEVLPLLTLHENNEITIEFKLGEKWTTIPYFNLSSGGDTLYIKAGLYEINLLGKFVEVGAQYENLNREHSGVFWYRNPRLYDKRTLLGLDVGNRKRPRQLYSVSGEKLYRYGIDDDLLELFIEKEFARWFRPGISLHYRNKRFSNIDTVDTPPAEFKDQIDRNQQSQYTSIKLYTRLGKINYDIFLQDGHELLLLAEQTLSQQTDRDFTRLKFHLKSYFTLPAQANLAINIEAQTINTHDLHQIFFIGGLDEVRGYFDGQFVGSSYWRSNVEYRIPSMNNKYMVIQHIFFFDIAQIKQRTSDISLDGSDTYSSYGLGLRFISPKIYSFNGRLDIAFPNSTSGASLISIGVQQFF